MFGKAIAAHVVVNTDDLVQPSRQTRYSDLSYTTLAHTSIHFFQEQYVTGTP